MTPNPGKTLWRDAARDGTIIGLLLCLTTVFNASTGFRMSGILGIIDILILVGFIFMFTRRRSQLYDREAGFSYGQSMGFIVLMMLFAGFFAGIGSYIASNVIDPNYYWETMNEYMLKITGGNTELYENSIRMSEILLENPIFHIISGIIGKVINGGLIGLFISVFVQRKPDIFANNAN